jgi:putative transposase
MAHQPTRFTAAQESKPSPSPGIRIIRTLKENLLWVRPFDTVEDLRQALLAFREVYNTTWLIERHGFQTPAAVRQNQLSPAALAA